ncbi:MAG: tetratricopeptide repeat protein [Rhodobacteraceae bacterium]|nr:tetratricopeptide repeat protein [Paracoccaceae bacterium]
MRALILLALTALPVAAQTCPAAADLSAERAALISQMQAAKTPETAADAMNRLWLLLTGAPDPKAQELLDRGMAERDDEDLDSALSAFDQLVHYCPDYPEGYNQRAFIEFLSADYADALEDVNTVLAMQPNHVAALSGKALVLMGLGRVDEAQAVLRAALALNPWLPERGMLIKPLGQSL